MAAGSHSPSGRPASQPAPTRQTAAKREPPLKGSVLALSAPAGEVPAGSAPAPAGQSTAPPAGSASSAPAPEDVP
eukprot:15380834-Alexandrium_andersonii.AAC.1